MPKYPEPEVSPSAVADSIIIGAIRQALGESSDIDIKELLVDCVDGIVRLTGTVRTFYEKQAAGNIAKSAKGVKGIENNLVVIADKQPNDSDIECEIAKALGDYTLEKDARIGVRTVDRGIAFLMGKASNAHEAATAVAIASKVPGVRKVISEIDIAPGVPVDDIEIKNSVNDALSTATKLEPYSIEVNVKDGDVYLYGEVEDEELIQTAVGLASTARGVKKVYSKIQIR